MRAYTTGDTEGVSQHSSGTVTGAAVLPPIVPAKATERAGIAWGGIPLHNSTGGDTAYGTLDCSLPTTAAKRPAAMGLCINEDLIVRSQDLVDTLTPGDVLDTPSALIELCGTIEEMWETAKDASAHHQGILAILENGTLTAANAGDVSESQISAFREALRDLARRQLSPVDEESISERFFYADFGPMSYEE